MSMEKYENLYKEALEKAKEFYTLCKKCGAKDTDDFLEDTFPELAESEDERIRKALIELVEYAKEGCFCLLDKPFNVVSMDAMLSWIEKQGKKPELPTWEEIHWLEWVIGILPASSKANEAEAELKELLEKIKNIKGCEE